MCKVSNCDGRARKSVPETETNPRRVLYATDFSPESQLPRFSSCTLPRMRTKTPLGPDAGRRLFPVALHVKHWLLEAGITLEYHVECRVPAEFIFEISEKLQIQLVVLSVRRRPLSANRCSVAWANSLQYGFSGPLSRAGKTGGPPLEE